MSEPQPPAPAKLFVGLIIKDKDTVPVIAEALTDAFGTMDLVSPWFPFDFTTYYEAEMGAHLYRRIFAFTSLIEQPALVDVKLATNKLEKKWTQNGKRQINLDPGYLLAERLVLATGKNFSHRIYLGSGIYADLTLIYQRGQYKALPWTYPGYRQPEMQRFLIQMRSKYMHDVRYRSS